MRLNWLPHRLTHTSRSRRRSERRKVCSRQPRLETLEDRTLPSTVSWINPNGGDWSNLANWSTGQLPGPSDDVVINLPGHITITHSTGSDSIRSLSGRDALVLSGGSLSISSNSVYSGPVTLSGTTLTGTGNLELDGQFTWNAGTMSGTGTTLTKGNVVLDNTAGFFQTGPTLDGRTFDNAKSATWTGGNISTGDGAVFDNLTGATFSIQTDATFDSNFGQQATFQNDGTVTKSVTTGTTTFNTLFNNTGSVFVDTGTLDLNGGGDATGSFRVASGATLGLTAGQYTLESASRVAGAGTVQFLDNSFSGNSTYNVNGYFAPSNTVISKGTVNFKVNTTLASLTMSGGTLSGAATVTVTGPLNWSGGTMNGGGTTIARGNVLINTANGFSGPTLDGRTFDNTKSATLTGSNGFTIVNGAVFDNLRGATFNVQSDSTIGGFFNSTGIFDNEGTFQKSVTTGTTSINAQFTNNGTVNVLSGTLALQNGGTSGGSFNVSKGAALTFGGNGASTTLTKTSKVSGGGAVNFTGSTINVLGIFSPSSTNISGGTVNFYGNGFLPSLTMTGGVLSDVGNITVTGLLTWDNGTMTGAGITTAAGGLFINASGFFGPTLDGRTLQNAKSATWIGGSFTVQNGAVLDNLKGATFSIQTDASMSSSFGQQGTFQNEGTITKSLTTGTTVIGTLFNNTGVVNVQSGALALVGGGTSSGLFSISSGAVLSFTGGTYTLASGSRVSGGGSVYFTNGTTNVLGSLAPTGGVTISNNATVNFVNNVTLTSLTMNGGALTGPSTVTVSGLLDWTGGTMNGPGATVARGGLVINAANSFFNNLLLDVRTFVNAQSATWAGGDFTIADGAVFENVKGATFTVQCDNSINSSGQQATFANAGTFIKTLTNGSTNIFITFNNTGTVDVQSGTLTLIGGGDATGAFTAEANATLDFAGQTYILEPSSSVGGAGTVQFGSTSFAGGTIYVEGTFNPAYVVLANGLVDFTQNLTLANLTMSGGTLTGPSTVTIAGPLNWTGGTMTGSGTTIAAGGLSIVTSTTGISNRTFKNEGTGTLNGAGVGGFTVSNGGTFDNAAGGMLTVLGSLTISPAFFQSPGNVSNEGTLTLSGSGNFLNISNETFTTSGTVNLNGNSMTTSGTYTQTGGTTNLQSGTLTVGGLGLVLQNTASLLGPGTVNGSVTNSGLVDAGSSGSPGQLNINGNYTQGGSGTLQAQLGGTSPGSGGYDQLVVNGSVALDGTLLVTLVNGFQPMSGEMFQIITSNAESGTFANELFPPGVNFQTTYSSSGVMLTAS